MAGTTVRRAEAQLILIDSAQSPDYNCDRSCPRRHPRRIHNDRKIPAHASPARASRGAEEDRRPWRRRNRAAWLSRHRARQSDTIKLGHITPRTGFLGQLGEYGFRGSSLAVEEINGAGGVLGRKFEVVAEDSVNPQTAVTKAQKLIERDKVVALIGEISSASGLAIGEQALRLKTPYFNTGCNSDELRGKNCNRFMFHIEVATRCTRRRSALAESRKQDQGRELVHAHRRLRVRP